MGIRSITKQPCEVCKEDTLHHACVCQTCKTIKESPTELRRNASVRLLMKYKKIYGNSYGRGVLHNKATEGKPREDYRSEKDFTQQPAGTFGKGRERKKV